MITRTGLADEIDGIELQIKVLNEMKSAALKAYRAQLQDAGMEPRRASAEVAATKAAIAKRRKLRENPDEAREKDELIDAILFEITSRPSRAREEGNEQAAAKSAAKNEPAAATETVGEYLREPPAVVSGQIIREGDAPRETDCQAGEASQGGNDASCSDTEFQSDSDAFAAVTAIGQLADADGVEPPLSDLPPSTDRSSTTSSAPEVSTPSEVNEVSGADLSDEVDAHEITRHRPLTGAGGHLSEPSSDAGAGQQAAKADHRNAKSGQAANSISDADVPAFLKAKKTANAMAEHEAA